MQVKSSGIAVRVAAAIALVMVTFNPSGLSYLHWVASGLGEDLPLKILGGIVLAILYIIFFRATLRSIGVVGICLILGLIAALVWVLVYYGLIDLTLGDQNPLIWITLLAFGIALGMGLSWSLIRRRLSGQADVDDVDA
ncbi:MAG: DUF6524 family protein [Pseudomonadota bacterium]